MRVVLRTFRLCWQLHTVRVQGQLRRSTLQSADGCPRPPGRRSGGPVACSIQRQGTMDPQSPSKAYLPRGQGSVRRGSSDIFCRYGSREGAMVFPNLPVPYVETLLYQATDRMGLTRCAMAQTSCKMHFIGCSCAPIDPACLAFFLKPFSCRTIQCPCGSISTGTTGTSVPLHLSLWQQFLLLQGFTLDMSATCLPASPSLGRPPQILFVCIRRKHNLDAACVQSHSHYRVVAAPASTHVALVGPPPAGTSRWHGQLSLTSSLPWMLSVLPLLLACKRSACTHSSATTSAALRR